MAGNVWEWCQDELHDNYEGVPLDGSAWISGSEDNSRVLRGGSWDNVARCCRGAYRYWGRPDCRDDNLGFRLAAGT